MDGPPDAGAIVLVVIHDGLSGHCTRGSCAPSVRRLDLDRIRPTTGLSAGVLDTLDLNTSLLLLLLLGLQHFPHPDLVVFLRLLAAWTSHFATARV